MWQKMQDIMELIVFKHSIFALPFLFTSMIVANYNKTGHIFFGFEALIFGVLCAVSARNFAMASNRLLDEDIDKHNSRCANRPNIDGRIGRKLLIGFIVANAVFFIALTYFINALAFKLSFLVIFMLGFYSFFKRFSASTHVFLGFCLGLAPIAGCVLISGQIQPFSLYLALGVSFWTAGFDVLYALQDMDYDKKAGLFSIPAKFGAQKSLAISAFFHALAVFFWLCFALSAKLGIIAYIGIFISAILLFLEHKIVRKDFSKIDKAFFTLNANLSIIFFIFILVDLWI